MSQQCSLSLLCAAGCTVPIPRFPASLFHAAGRTGLHGSAIIVESDVSVSCYRYLAVSIGNNQPESYILVYRACRVARQDPKQAETAWFKIASTDLRGAVTRFRRLYPKCLTPGAVAMGGRGYGMFPGLHRSLA